MDIRGLNQLLKSCDRYEEASFSIPVGVVDHKAVSLYAVVDSLMGPETLTWYIVRHGNPGTVVLTTEDQEAAATSYCDEIAKVKAAQAERLMWRA